MKSLWVVNHHALLPSKDGRSGRHLAFARHLRALGWDTTLIVSSTRHPSGTQALPGFRLRQTTQEDGTRTRWVRATPYGRSTPLRFVGMVVFAVVALLPRATKGLPKPDLVLGSTVHPLAAWAGWRLARRHGVPFVYEIRDVWPDILIQLGKLKQNGLTARFMRALSSRLAKRAMLVISPLPRVDEYLRTVGAQDVPFVWVSNGIERPNEVELPSSRRAAARTPFTFMYLGSYNHSNRVADIIDAFTQLVRERPDREWRLRIVGDGPLEEALRTRSEESGCGHLISVEGPVPRSLVLSRAQEADCLVAMLHGYEVYAYGISLNKLFEYLLAARPVVFATNAPDNPVDEAGAGIVVAPDDRRAFVDAMARLADSSQEERDAMGGRGRGHVVANYSYDALAAKLAAELNRLVADKTASGSAP